LGLISRDRFAFTGGLGDGILADFFWNGGLNSPLKSPSTAQSLGKHGILLLLAILLMLFCSRFTSADPSSSHPALERDGQTIEQYIL
jgi:hypothetical protein